MVVSHKKRDFLNCLFLTYDTIGMEEIFCCLCFALVQFPPLFVFVRGLLLLSQVGSQVLFLSFKGKGVED